MEERQVEKCKDNLLFFHIYRIFSLFNLTFFHIFHISSIFDFPFFHIFHIISLFSAVFSESFLNSEIDIENMEEKIS
jgi:hypothetical protein